MEKLPLIRRVVIRNYKSIEKCDVTLGQFNVFVGRNGAGKSNFLDALQFVSDALSTGSLSHALELRGGMQNILRRSENSPRSFRVQLEVQLSATQGAEYVIEIAEQPHGGFAVAEEELIVQRTQNDVPILSVFRCDNGRLIHLNDLGILSRDLSNDIVRSVSNNVLYLPIVSILPEYRPFFDALSGLNFYNPIPDLIRLPHLSETWASLKVNGSNLMSAVSRLAREHPDTVTRIVEYLSQIAPGLTAIKPLFVSGYELLEFEQQVPGESEPRKFQSQNMSDGTLRSLAVLVAALQYMDIPDSSKVIGIEEPEAAIHPAAMAVLLDALREASVNTQILITTHSPDLLDRVDMETDTLFVVSDVTGSTVIAPIDRASESAIRDHLYTPGELLRMDQLEPRVEYPVQGSTPQ